MEYKHLDKSSRMELAILRKKGYSIRSIAEVLGVSPSSVSRELGKNALRTGEYNPERAQQKAYARRKYSKYEGMKIRKESWLENYVKEKLKAGWTPEQISGRLKKEKGEPVISFKVIYKWIYSAYGQAYAQYLPSKRDRVRKRRKKKSKRQMIPNRTWIDARPTEINERKRIGDFEGDTLGKPKHSPETLVGVADRKSRFFVAKKVHRLKRSMEDGFQKIQEEIPMISLTLDNGVENVRHESLGLSTYFCHPYSSWEKGTIENTFQRLRRDIPKGSHLSDFSHRAIASIVDRMNNTPRKCLDFRTPAEVFKDQFD